MRMKRLILLSILGLLAFPAVALAGGRDDDDDDDRGHHKRDVEVQLLGLNDFHGHLEPNTPGTIAPAPGAERVPAGGAEYLATHLRMKERRHRNSLIVSAGDLIGASPLLSALFHDEPTIEAMNKIGLDLNAVGNHEFDEGAAELQRMQRGGCHPADGCLDGDGFRGAKFDFLAANVVNERGRTIFPAYAIEKFDGIKVGFIGMTLEGTPNIVSPSGVAGLRFLDEAETANRYADELRRRHGVRAVVVLLHEGGVQSGSSTGPNTCTGISGPVVDIVNRTTSQVDLFVTGHTHTAYNCVIDGRPVTSASSFGRLFTDIDMTLDPRSKDVVEVVANNQVVTQNVFKATDMTDLISRYSAIAAPLRDRVIARISEDITQDNDDSREQEAGNLIADAQHAATASPTTGSAVAAFMNPGGVRAPFTFAPSGSEAPGEVTYGEAFTVQPFGNSLVTMTLTGAQILEMLKLQWCGQGTAPKVLLPSASVHYTFSQSVASGLASVAATGCAGAPNPVSGLTIGGTPVDPAASYRITVNSFLADGGDGFPVLRQGTDRLGGEVDTDALEDYLAPSLEGAPIGPPALDRIDVTP
jgi:5'-nucleotidase